MYFLEICYGREYLYSLEAISKITVWFSLKTSVSPLHQVHLFGSATEVSDDHAPSLQQVFKNVLQRGPLGLFINGVNALPHNYVMRVNIPCISIYLIIYEVKDKIAREIWSFSPHLNKFSMLPIRYSLSIWFIENKFILKLFMEIKNMYMEK